MNSREIIYGIGLEINARMEHSMNLATWMDQVTFDKKSLDCSTKKKCYLQSTFFSAVALVHPGILSNI